MALSCSTLKTVGVGNGGKIAALGEGIGVAVGTRVGVAVATGVRVGVPTVCCN